MPAPDTRITEFVEKAIAAGIPPESVASVLSARGWSQKQVYEALANHYQQLVGVEIPRRTAAGAAAKEAFFYLLIFATLATWTIGFGALAFALIDRWLADPLFTGQLQIFDTSTIASSLASLIVAFPLYLLISRAAARETLLQPERLDSPVRKWLTYLALVIAAGVFMGDLITALTYLLRGEVTARFLAKACVVLVLSGGVFSYYFTGLRKTLQPASRDRRMACASAGLVAVAVILGFLQLGSPSRQRQLRADELRLRQIYALTMEIRNYWNGHQSQLPTTLDQLGSSIRVDPVTHEAYPYHPGQGSQYQLCATFAQSSDPREDALDGGSWKHAAGSSCFRLDASILSTPPVMQSPGY